MLPRVCPSAHLILPSARAVPPSPTPNTCSRPPVPAPVSSPSQSADHGVPFDLDDLRIRMASGQLGESYETAILRLEKEIEDVAAGKDRLRMAAKTLAARLDMDGVRPAFSSCPRGGRRRAQGKARRRRR